MTIITKMGVLTYVDGFVLSFQNQKIALKNITANIAATNVLIIVPVKNPKNDPHADRSATCTSCL
jgi:hypothetical protein